MIIMIILNPMGGENRTPENPFAKQKTYPSSHISFLKNSNKSVFINNFYQKMIAT